MLEFMKQRLAGRRLLACRAVRRLVRKEDGAAAIEFAAVGAPFFFLLFAIIETGLMLWGSQTLETAVADAGRMIMTGQAQTKGFDQTQFKQDVCARLAGGLLNCNNVYLDVQTKPTFAQFNRTVPFDAEGNFQPGQVGYQPGGPDAIVLVRAFYQWPLFIPRPTDKFSMPTKHLIVATAAFRNEPFNPPAN